MKIIVVIAFLGLLVTGCSKQAVGPSTPPAKVNVPDKDLLLEISRKAIAARLPDVQFDNLELRDVTYLWHIDDLNQYTNEQFYVGFRVRGSKRKVEEDGETVFKVDTVGVDIEPDGQIDRGGVSRGTETFRSEDENMFSLVSSQGDSVWGDPFFPIKRDAPPPCPDRHNLNQIALRAIHRFLPTVDTDDLIMRSATFVDMKRPEHKVEHVGLSVTFWLASTVRTNVTPHEVVVDREEIEVQISTNGQVSAHGVRKYPGSIRYNRHALPEPCPPSVQMPNTKAQRAQ